MRNLGLTSAVVLVVVMVGCGEGEGPVSESLSPTTAVLQVVSGDQQTGSANRELPEPLIVRALDERGHGVRDQILNWVVTAGDGHVFAGTTITDRKGESREWWTLGPSLDPDANRLEVRAVDPTTGEKLIFAAFSATGTLPPILSVVVEPMEQRVLVDEPLPFTATAYDIDGERPDAAFTWSYSNPAAVRETDEGPVGGEPGTATLATATAGNVSGSANLEVYGIEPDELEFRNAEDNNQWDRASDIGLLENETVELALNFHRIWESTDWADWILVQTLDNHDYETCSADVAREFTFTITVTADPAMTGPMEIGRYLHQDWDPPLVDAWQLGPGESWTWTESYSGETCADEDNPAYLFELRSLEAGELAPDTDYRLHFELTSVPPGS